MLGSKERIIEVAAALMASRGLRVTQSQIARKCGIGKGTVTYHFKSMENLRTAVIASSIKSEDLGVLAKALGEGHPAVRKLPAALRAKVASHLTGS
jgi:AcrR family transcriptional regulator